MPMVNGSCLVLGVTSSRGSVILWIGKEDPSGGGVDDIIDMIFEDIPSYTATTLARLTLRNLRTYGTYYFYYDITHPCTVQVYTLTRFVGRYGYCYTYFSSLYCKVRSQILRFITYDTL